MDKLEKLAKVLNDAKKILADIDPKAFVDIDLMRNDGVPQVMIHGAKYDPIFKFEKDGAIAVNGVAQYYADYGVTIDNVHFFKSIPTGGANNASMAV
jgi:hypothetical protein